jgi:sporulation protein YlmC with PRC-barrel domain
MVPIVNMRRGPVEAAPRQPLGALRYRLGEEATVAPSSQAGTEPNLTTAVSSAHHELEEGIMISKYLASALVITALGTGVATAQTATTRTDAAAAAAAHREGEWRASKLVGVDVYNEANEKIGDISEIILDKSGKVANVIIGVGGFLGMGEHYVAVGYDKLKWVNEPARSASAASDRPAAAPATRVDSNARTASDGSVRTTTTGTASSSARNTNWYPDHVVFNATKDQLKAMPEFKY